MFSLSPRLPLPDTVHRSPTSRRFSSRRNPSSKTSTGYPTPNCCQTRRCSELMQHIVLGILLCTGHWVLAPLAEFTWVRSLCSNLGRFSCRLVRSRHNTRFYAIKVLSKEKIVRTKQVEHTKSERAMLEAVHHPFIVNLWGTFQDPENLYMVMDFVAGGELFSLLRKSKV